MSSASFFSAGNILTYKCVGTGSERLPTILKIRVPGTPDYNIRLSPFVDDELTVSSLKTHILGEVQEAFTLNDGVEQALRFFSYLEHVKSAHHFQVYRDLMKEMCVIWHNLRERRGNDDG